MEKIVYISHFDIDEDSQYPGVIKKIKAQMEAFSLAGFKCEYCRLPYPNKTLLQKLQRILPFYNNHRQWAVTENLLDADGIYCRVLGEWDYYMLKFFANIKKYNPKCKIVLEIPTYPYDKEYLFNVKGWILLLKDKIFRKYIHYYIDRVATLTDDKVIFNIPTLKFRNGIDMRNICARNKAEFCTMPDIINCIAVANISWWHGYDRFIEGMRLYYRNGGNRQIVFHLVGDGSDLLKLKRLVHEYHLDKHVIFYGRQIGKSLDEIYDKCGIAVASLGGYRKGLSVSATLKSREYMAKGIPFVSAEKILDIDDRIADKYYLKVSNDSSPIDIKDLVNYYDNFYENESPADVIYRLRKYAEENYAISKSMSEVIKYFMQK